MPVIIIPTYFQILNPSHAYDPSSHLIAGGAAGGLAAAVTTPLDCIKTVMLRYINDTVVEGTVAVGASGLR